MLEERLISEPRIVAEITRSRKTGPIHVIGGPLENRLTVYSQQCRAINLVCALCERDPELAKRRIAVIGAGAAGVTAAAALCALGVGRERLTVFEKAASPMFTQRWSYGRFLHPQLFHWPEEGWQDDRAGLPIGDWRAGYAAAVREQILGIAAGLPIRYCREVIDVERRGKRARVTFRHLHALHPRHGDFDLVLVATGFPFETKVAGTHDGTY